MYRECRYVRDSGGRCNLPVINDGNWCYFHSRLQERQSFRYNRRGPDGRFAALPAPSQSEELATTVDYGTIPVGAATKPDEQIPENATIDLPSLEDPVSIQLALIDVVHALAANRIDTKRAGLLLYALQVASANTRHMKLNRFDAVRTITYDEAGLPLAPQRQAEDTSDINERLRGK